LSSNFSELGPWNIHCLDGLAGINVELAKLILIFQPTNTITTALSINMYQQPFGYDAPPQASYPVQYPSPVQYPAPVQYPGPTMPYAQPAAPQAYVAYPVPYNDAAAGQAIVPAPDFSLCDERVNTTRFVLPPPFVFRFLEADRCWVVIGLLMVHRVTSRARCFNCSRTLEARLAT
jgi:hypothetical protein